MLDGEFSVASVTSDIEVSYCVLDWKKMGCALEVHAEGFCLSRGTSLGLG